MLPEQPLAKPLERRRLDPAQNLEQGGLPRIFGRRLSRVFVRVHRLSPCVRQSGAVLLALTTDQFQCLVRTVTDRSRRSDIDVGGRTDLFERRRTLMQQWADYLADQTSKRPFTLSDLKSR